jgi:hypothetical protein
VVPHVGLRPVQQAFEFQAVGVAVRYHVAHLSCKRKGGEVDARGDCWRREEETGTHPQWWRR